MKEPTGVFGHVEMSDELFYAFQRVPIEDLKEFLQRCKVLQYERLDGAVTPEDRHKVQVRAQFVDEWKKFFQTLLTKPHKPTNI